ncbi:MAG: hypothetical protein Q8O93_02515 [bacterium]|nr:hypothetical protein [bacterium]
MKLNRLLPLLIPLIVLALDELYFFYPKLIFIAAALIGLALFYAVWQLGATSQVDREWWNYLILPAITSVGVVAYSVFLSSKTVIQLLFIFNLAFLYLYLRYIYYYLLWPVDYQAFSMENLSSYVSWFSFFLAASVIYGLQSFLNLPVLGLILVLLAVMILIIYQIFWVNKIDWRAGLPYILVSCLILIELAWSISFLPFNYNISGLALAICFYAAVGLTKNHLLDKLDAKKVKMYLILSAVSIILVLTTARWI